MNLGKVLLKQLMEAGRELQDSRIVFSDVLSLVDLLFLENIQTLQILQAFSLFLNGGKIMQPDAVVHACHPVLGILSSKLGRVAKWEPPSETVSECVCLKCEGELSKKGDRMKWTTESG